MKPYAGIDYANPHAATTINGVTYTYDNNGNLATSSPNVYYWDYRDRMVKSSNGTATSTYAYDENNSRIRKTILGTATTTYPNAYYNYSSTGSTTAHILLPDGTPIATVEAKNGAATSTYWLHLDHLGSVQTITNASGTQTQTLDYYPYGDQRIASSSGAFSEQRQYIGKDYDPDSDLDYLEARYYSGDKGRFLSQDPIFNSLPSLQDLKSPQSLNSYSYANDNPIVNKDPTGKSYQSTIAASVKSALMKFNLSSFFGSFLSNFSSNKSEAANSSALQGKNTYMSVPLPGGYVQQKTSDSCVDACADMLGYRPSLQHAIYTAKFDSQGKLTTQANAENGIKTIDSYLQSGQPIQVGLNINGGTEAGNIGHEQTQHSVVINGSGTDAGGKYYHFADPYPGHGMGQANKLYLKSDNSLSAPSTYGTGKTFIVTEVRPK